VSGRVANRAGLSPARLARVESELPRHRTLQEMMAWGLAQPAGACLPRVVAEVVVQDEYTHDLVVPWRGLFLVYGAT